MGKRRTSLLVDDTLLRRAKKALGASTNTAAITSALQEAVVNREVERSLRELLRDGRGRFVDVYGKRA